MKVAVIGAGAMAREHIRAFADIPDVQIMGIHSRTQTKANELALQFGIPKVCHSIAELYESTQAELVIVTVSSSAMKAVTLDCTAYPWTIFIEKPPGLNMQEVNELQAAAQARIFVGLNRRFLSSTRSALDGLDKQSPRHIVVQDQQSLEVAQKLHSAEIAHHWMYVNSIHVIDYLRLFGRGKITRIIPIFRWMLTNPSVVLVALEFDSGDTGLYEGIWNGPGPWAVTISTPESRWELRPLEEGTLQKRGERVRQPITIHQWDRDFKPGFRLQAEAVVNAAQGKTSNIPTLADAAETMRLITQIFFPS